MRSSDFIKKSLILILVALLFTIVGGRVYVSASMEGIYGGAEVLVKDAVYTLKNESADSISPFTENSSTIDDSKPKDLSGTFLNGVSMGNVDLSGKTYEEGLAAIKDYVASLSGTKVKLNSIGGNSVDATLSDFGMYWDDERGVEEAFLVGNEGSIIDRYKARKDVEYEKKKYPLRLGYNRDLIKQIVSEQADLYNIAGEPARLTKEDGDFTIIPGVSGQEIDIKSSVAWIIADIENPDGQPITIDLKVNVQDSQAQIEELEKVHDVIGSYKTSFSSSSKDRSGNVTNGTNLVDGTVLYPGEQFSMYETVSPFTEENGYFLAGSYSNGMVVESFGGGICQVSSTLYNAVLRAELEVVERYNHSMIVSYVDLSSDAAISGTSKDFKFKNNKDYPIYIEGYTTSDKQVIFNIYGIEDRPANREVTFESVKLSETVLDTERVVADSSMPLGSISVQSPHTGYEGELWKVVKVDGVETERTQVNRSVYHASPKTASVGTATDNPTALAIVQSAIATGSIEYVRSVIAGLNAAAAAAQ